MNTRNDPHALPEDRLSRRPAGLRAAGLAALPVFFLLLLGCTSMEKRALSYVDALPPEQVPGGVIGEADLAGLPAVVQRYLRHSGVLGKPRIDSFALTMEGRIRQGPQARWMPFVARQYNLLSEPARVYYIHGKRTPMAGIDSWLDGKGRMQIKVLGLFTVADSQGAEMDRSALVTFLNDLGFCPLAFFSVPVVWTEIDDRHAGLSLTHAGLTAAAVLTFDAEGRLLNWETADRYADVEGKAVPDRWSTPTTGCLELAGLRLPIGNAIHDYDGNPFVYAELTGVRNLTWNVRGLPAER